jgi:hypothetical protein
MITTGQGHAATWRVLPARSRCWRSRCPKGISGVVVIRAPPAAWLTVPHRRYGYSPQRQTALPTNIARTVTGMVTGEQI